MKVVIDNEITISDAPVGFKKWLDENYVVPNPEYEKKEKMGFWLGNTPRKLYLYRERGFDAILPYGTRAEVVRVLGNPQVVCKIEKKTADYKGASIPLYDYQEKAVAELLQHQSGILQAPAGSGKTQMGIAFILRRGEKALWLTHTKDLLQQSYDRAAQYVDKRLLGKITEGKVQIGEGITFATVQTLSQMDLEQYKREWSVVVVDECHRVAGSPSKVTQFGKILNALSAEKFGLSATVHRADGLIAATYAMLGKIVYSVPADAVKDKVDTVTILKRETDTPISEAFLDTDGTLLYGKMIDYLCGNSSRNEMIIKDLVYNSDHCNLILSDRVEHLRKLYSMLPQELQDVGFVVDGKTKASIRNRNMEDMREGKMRYMFATYRLAKEGLDIPRLDRLYLATPQKDYAIITQSIGRIARHFNGKEMPVAYDYVDSEIRYCAGQWKARVKSYKKLGSKIIGS